MESNKDEKSISAPFCPIFRIRLNPLRIYPLLAVSRNYHSLEIQLDHVRPFGSKISFSGRLLPEENRHRAPKEYFSVSSSIRSRTYAELRCKYGVVLVPTRGNVETICACLLANIEISFLIYLIWNEREKIGRERQFIRVIRCR